MKTWAQVAQLVSSQGLKGRCIAHSVQGLPFFLEKGMKVHFVPPTLEGPRCATVSSIEYHSNRDYVVSFKGISDRDTAQRLAGSYCLVKRSDLPENFEDMTDYGWEILGFSVEDETFGTLGEIEQVDEMPTQDLLYVQGPFGQVLIPYVEEFILEVDEENKVMHTRIPSGLLSLGEDEPTC